jgi:hypothetical protein
MSERFDTRLLQNTTKAGGSRLHSLLVAAALPPRGERSLGNVDGSDKMEWLGVANKKLYIG